MSGSSHHLATDRRAEAGNPQAREMVDFEQVGFGAEAVDVVPCRGEDAFVGQPEVVQDNDWFVAVGVVVCQLDLRHHPVSVTLGDEHRSVFVRRLLGEGVRIDESNARGDRIDAECRPRFVEKTHRRDHRGDDRRLLAQQSDGALENERAAGDRVEHLTVVGCGVDEASHDCAVHVLEAGVSLVLVVEGHGVADRAARGMARRAYEAVRDPCNVGRSLRGDPVDGSGAEADDGDPPALCGHHVISWRRPSRRAGPSVRMSSRRGCRHRRVRRAIGSRLRRRRSWPQSSRRPRRTGARR
jgi:hypothetical protein